MQPEISYGDQTFRYQINVDEKRSTRVAIHVDPDGSVVVDAPPGFDDATIHRAVQKRARWVANNVVAAKARFAHVTPREYVSGEQVMYLGRRYVLKVVRTSDHPKSVKLIGSRLLVQTKSGDPEDVKGRLRAWYRVKARNYFMMKISEFTGLLPWVDREPAMKLVAMTKQWGSCSPGGQIILNPKLIKAPRQCIEYVIIHELAHLKYHDHGTDFWTLVSAHVPGWKQHKKQLDALVEVIMLE